MARRYGNNFESSEEEEFDELNKFEEPKTKDFLNLNEKDQKNDSFLSGKDSTK
jgi:hypothetical protein